MPECSPLIVGDITFSLNEKREKTNPFRSFDSEAETVIPNLQLSLSCGQKIGDETEASATFTLLAGPKAVLTQAAPFQNEKVPLDVPEAFFNLTRVIFKGGSLLLQGGRFSAPGAESFRSDANATLSRDPLFNFAPFTLSGGGIGIKINSLLLSLSIFNGWDRQIIKESTSDGDESSKGNGLTVGFKLFDNTLEFASLEINGLYGTESGNERLWIDSIITVEGKEGKVIATCDYGEEKNSPSAKGWGGCSGTGSIKMEGFPIEPAFRFGYFKDESGVRTGIPKFETVHISAVAKLVLMGAWMAVEFRNDRELAEGISIFSDKSYWTTFTFQLGYASSSP